MTAPSVRDRLAEALSTQDRRLKRLVLAKTSVNFQIAGPQPDSITLLLDGDTPSLADDSAAEITVQLDQHQAAAFAVGRLPLPPLVHAGRIAYRGPVRKYMTVHAVLKALLADLAAAAA